MQVWYENYGADADGNRGVKTLMWELEGTEQEIREIAELIREADHGSDDVGINVSITYEGIDMEVDVDDYMDEIIAQEQSDLRQQIETLGIVPFDQIKMIHKTGDTYPIGSKSLEEVLEDLSENGYSPIPF